MLKLSKTELGAAGFHYIDIGSSAELYCDKCFRTTSHVAVEREWEHGEWHFTFECQDCKMKRR